MKQAKTLLAAGRRCLADRVASLRAADTPAKGEWTGLHHGRALRRRKGANKEHTAACVEKCMKSGTKAQIWIEADNKGIDLDDFSKVKALVGEQGHGEGHPRPRDPHDHGRQRREGGK